MKLTKSKLQQIIKEELQHALQTEGFGSWFGKKKTAVDPISEDIKEKVRELVKIWTDPNLLQSYEEVWNRSVSKDKGAFQRKLPKPVPRQITNIAQPFLSIHRDLAELIDNNLRSLGQKLDEVGVFSSSAVRAARRGRGGDSFFGGIDQGRRPPPSTPKEQTPEEKAVHILTTIKQAAQETAQKIEDPRTMGFGVSPTGYIQQSAKKISELIEKL